MLKGLSNCANLKWLSVIENKLVSLKGVEGLSKLQVSYFSAPQQDLSLTASFAMIGSCSSPVVQVLNAGKNKLKTMDEVKSLTSLGALILNGNAMHKYYVLSVVFWFCW